MTDEIRDCIPPDRNPRKPDIALPPGSVDTHVHVFESKYILSPERGEALDLVGRKLPAHMGRYLRRFFHPVAAYIEAHQDDPELAEFITPLAKAFGRLQRASAWIAQSGLRDPEEAGAAATDYLRLFGLTVLAYLWTRMAEISMSKLETEERRFYQAKIDTARFYMQRLLPQSGGLFSTILAGGGSIMAFDDEAF